MYTISYDEESGILLFENSGFWTPGEARIYMEEMERETARARQATGKLKLLVDGREASVLSAEAAIVLADFENHVIVAPTDRVAVAVGSSLAKMQTRRNFPSAQSELFMSLPAATNWLHAYG